ncbi:Predicted phosphohydrolase, MPP superfamily [Bacillus sp. cl95]|nr:Predicted phosphohydrolase, MPP superfamily [Bacillus sp. UNCCL13]SFQ80867.1 Predicted phosphohydrolase, MPP superfamily [Bacillus sp. cl95]
MLIFLITILLFGMALFFFMLKEAFENRVVEHNINLEDFPESFGEVSIFFISDVHRRKIDEKILNKVKGKVDIVIIGGDLTEKKVPLSRVKENIAKLKTLGPVYFVWGNNDYEIDYHELDATLLENGVKILDNTAVTFESEKEDKFVLLGVDEISEGRDRLDLALSDAGAGGFRVLVCHNPKIMEQVKPEYRISLVLSGHTHGGQIRILGFGPYQKGGISRVHNTTVLVSNGYGTTALPLRLGAPSETHLIKLKQQI